jgi:hypothetical protein
LAFRSLPVGLTEAHGKGMAMQFNYLFDMNAFVAHRNGTFTVDMTKTKGADRDLCHDLLTIEAHSDYAGAKNMLDTRASPVPPCSTPSTG